MMIVFALLLLLMPLRAHSQQLQSPQAFKENCVGCHGEEGRGTAKGPALAMNGRVAARSAEQLNAYLEHGDIAAGMPSFSDLPDADRMALVRYLRSLNEKVTAAPARPRVAASCFIGLCNRQ